jgi:hypothetical protein
MPDFYTFYFYVSAILVVALLLIVSFEMAMHMNGKPGDNMNFLVYSWAKGKYFFITFFWGVLAGHLFMGSKQPLITISWLSIVLAAVLGLSLILIGVRLNRSNTSAAFQLALLILGVLFGHWVWSMNG